MQKTIDNAQRDPEAVLLARVYALILTWGEPEPSRADAANAHTPRKGRMKKQEEDKKE